MTSDFRGGASPLLVASGRLRGQAPEGPSAARGGHRGGVVARNRRTVARDGPITCVQIGGALDPVVATLLCGERDRVIASTRCTDAGDVQARGNANDAERG